MTYDEAMTAAGKGARVRRAFWPWNYLQSSMANQGQLYFRGNELYKPSDEDLQATDWEVVQMSLPNAPAGRVW